MDKKILNISISILMITLSLSLFQIVNRVNQYFTIQESVLLQQQELVLSANCLLYTSPSPRDRTRSRMPSSA